MKTSIKVSIVSILLAIFTLTNAFGGDSSLQESGGRHHGPPPEAYDACEGQKWPGIWQNLSARSGDTVTGGL